MITFYSKIKKHIIGKAFFWRFGILTPVFLGWCYFIYLIMDNIFLPFSLGNLLIYALSFLLIMSIYYNFISLYRCKKFYKFHENSLTESNVQLCKINIEKKDFQVQVPNSTQSATVNSFPQPTNAVYLETDEFLLLFFSIQHFYIVKEVLKPYVFIKTDKDLHIKNKNVIVVRDFKMVETEQGRAITFSNKQGIKRIGLPSQFNTNEQRESE